MLIHRKILYTIGFFAFAVSSVATAESYEIEPTVPADQGIAEILGEYTLVHQPNRYIGWPGIVCTPEGTLVVSFSGDRDWHVCPWGKIQMTRSTDGGKTWSEAKTIVDTPTDDRGTGLTLAPDGSIILQHHASPVFAKRDGPRYDKYDGHVARMGMETIKQWDAFWLHRSTDDGLTWRVQGQSPSHTPKGPATLDDGRLLMVRPKVSESHDLGKTWNEIGQIERPPADRYDNRYAFLSEQHAVDAGDGRLVALSRYRTKDNLDHELRQTVSTDGGKTWSEPAATGMVGYPAHLLRLHNGDLLAVYGRRLDPMGQRACISKDQGRTWLTDQEIVLSYAAPQGSGDLGYPSSAQLPDGTIWTVYYQVEKPAHGEFPSLMATHWRLKETAAAN